MSLYNQALRRVSAVALLLLFSTSLIPVALFADSESNLPACCRRHGKHGCAMAGMMDMQSESNTSAGVKPRTVCHSFPKGDLAPAAAKIYGVPPSARLVTVIVVHLTLSERADTLYRISFSRTCQKRGPPALLS